MRGVRRWVDELQRPVNERGERIAPLRGQCSTEYKAFHERHRALLRRSETGAVPPSGLATATEELRRIAAGLRDAGEREDAMYDLAFLESLGALGSGGAAMTPGWLASAEYQAFGAAHRRLLADLSGGVVASDAAAPRIAELRWMADLLTDPDERDGAIAEVESVASLVAQMTELDGAGPEWQQASRLVAKANADPALARDAIAQVEALAARAPEADRLSIQRMADFLARLASAGPGESRGRP